MKTKSISSSYHLSDQVGDLLDGIHLLLEVLGLQEVTEVSIIDVLTNLVEIKETLIDLNESSVMISLNTIHATNCFLKLQGGSHGLQSRAPLRASRFSDVLEYDLPSSFHLMASLSRSRDLQDWFV